MLLPESVVPARVEGLAEPRSPAVAPWSAELDMAPVSDELVDVEAFDEPDEPYEPDDVAPVEFGEVASSCWLGWSAVPGRSDPCIWPDRLPSSLDWPCIAQPATARPATMTAAAADKGLNLLLMMISPKC